MRKRRPGAPERDSDGASWDRRRNRPDDGPGLIVVEPSRRRGPFDPRWTDVKRRRHLRLVPQLAEPDDEGARASAAAFENEANSGRGFASVTYLPAFIPPDPERDWDVELEGREGEEDLAWPIAAVLPVPTL